MANPKILKLSFDGKYPDYTIPKKYKDEVLFISTFTTLDKPGWDLDLVHAVNVNGDPVAHSGGNRLPDIDRLELGTCSGLDKQKLSLVSIATRIDGSGAVPKAHYKVLLEAGNEKIEAFEIYSDTNPATFYTKATIIIET